MYLNAYDRGSVICMLSTLYHIGKLKDNKIIDEDLKDELTQIKNLIEDFREKLYERMGKKFANTVLNEVNSSELMLVRNTSPDIKEAREKVRKGVLFREVIEEVGLNCFNCECKDYENCKYFIFFDFFEHSGETKDNVCPFR